MAQLCHEIALRTNSSVQGQALDVAKESHSIMKIHVLNAEQDIFGLLFDTIGLTPAIIGNKRPRTASEKGEPFRLQAPGEVPIHTDSKLNQTNRIDAAGSSVHVVTTSFVTVVVAPGGNGFAFFCKN
jgi:hypothetical protein